ncbi:hypothetical protein GGR55DRAFT_689175 [Xylaria sp. FL0064]|nr:hypothetical protein GGR55DRAFT_689175 [Xylaria sp. FL0064]
MSSHGIPEVLMTKVDEYVDSLAAQVQPRIATELELFQQKTIDSLEAQVIEAFRSLFSRDGAAPPGQARTLDSATPETYGGQSLPFATEIAGLTGCFTKIVDETGDDVRDIFGLTEGRANSGNIRSTGDGRLDASQLARGFFSAAVNAVQDHLDQRSDGQKLELDGLLGVLTNNIKDVVRSPEDTARRISPEIKEKVGARLREQHAPIAEQFTRIALDHIKRWLRGNTSARDLGAGAKGEIEDHVKDLVKGIGGLFGSKRDHGEGSSRDFSDRERDAGEVEGGRSGGFSEIISEKLSTGLGRVHREVRLEFRKVLGSIEKELFELLPDEFQGPLEKILGGNPFDSQLQRDPGSSIDRGFGNEMKTKLVDKIRGVVTKVQSMLRESILGVVNGGHRKFERESWISMQVIIEQKVQRYLPKVRITVPDDIGDEGVSLGAPKPTLQSGNDASQFAPPAQHEYQRQTYQEYQPDNYRPQQDYPGVDQYNQPQSYQQSQSYQSSQWHGQNPPY